MALSYSTGIRGMPRDIEKAITLYEESMKKGNPKAAINLGTLYRTAFASQWGSEKERFDYMNALYEHAIKMGCPDGYYFLAMSYYKGWGVKIDQKKGDAYIKTGAEAGGLAPMYGYGMALKEDKRIEEAKIWLHKALEGGFGLAGYKLSFIYLREKNYEKQIENLRKGARLGDISCLYALGDVVNRFLSKEQCTEFG